MARIPIKKSETTETREPTRTSTVYDAPDLVKDVGSIANSVEAIAKRASRADPPTNSVLRSSIKDTLTPLLEREFNWTLPLNRRDITREQRALLTDQLGLTGSQNDSIARLRRRLLEILETIGNNMSDAERYTAKDLIAGLLGQVNGIDSVPAINPDGT